MKAYWCNPEGELVELLDVGERPLREDDMEPRVRIRVGSSEDPYDRWPVPGSCWGPAAAALYLPAGQRPTIAQEQEVLAALKADKAASEAPAAPGG